MTLADFLLARIAEDEAVAVCSDGAGCPNQDFEFSPGLTDCNTLNVGPNRWRAECEAKRRIVDWAAPILTNWPNAPEGFRYVSDDGLDLLRILAVPYADHPDYCEEWKP